MAFFPLDLEVNILPLLHLQSSKQQFFVPHIKGDDFIAVKLRRPFQRGAYGIKTCTMSLFNKFKLDLMLVPVLAVDSSFKRIGMGKGMYDRFVANLSYKPFLVFIQRRSIIIRHKVCDAWDIQGDFLVSHQGIFKAKECNYDHRVNIKQCNFSFTSFSNH